AGARKRNTPSKQPPDHSLLMETSAVRGGDPVAPVDGSAGIVAPPPPSTSLAHAAETLHRAHVAAAVDDELQALPLHLHGGAIEEGRHRSAAQDGFWRRQVQLSCACGQVSSWLAS